MLRVFFGTILFSSVPKLVSSAERKIPIHRSIEPPSALSLQGNQPVLIADDSFCTSSLKAILTASKEVVIFLGGALVAKKPIKGISVFVSGGILEVVIDRVSCEAIVEKIKLKRKERKEIKDGTNIVCISINSEIPEAQGWLKRFWNWVLRRNSRPQSFEVLDQKYQALYVQSAQSQGEGSLSSNSSEGLHSFPSSLGSNVSQRFTVTVKSR